MSNDDILDRIQKRREQIERGRAKLLQQLDDLNREQQRLEQEAQELDIAARVLNRLSPDETEQSKNYTPPWTKPGKKPDGIPAMSDMIQTVLLAAEKDGIAELETQNIVNAIRIKWWPDAQNNDVAPVLWRQAKIGRLIKNGTRYRRNIENSAPSEGTTK